MQLGQLIASATLVVLVALQGAAAELPPRARDLGIAPGVMEPGPHNAITDVAGVKVGHVTLISGDRVRTGVTALLPHDGNLFQQKVPGAVFVGNAFGNACRLDAGVGVPPAIAGERDPLVTNTTGPQGGESLLLLVPECGVARYGKTW